MKFATEYLWFETKQKRELLNITDRVAAVVAQSGIQEGMVLVSAMHITAGVIVNDHEPDFFPASIERVLAETVSGGVSVNETILHVAQDDLPFGGVGPSGMGHYHAFEGFETFSFLPDRVVDPDADEPPEQ